MVNPSTAQRNTGRYPQGPNKANKPKVFKDPVDQKKEPTLTDLKTDEMKVNIPNETLTVTINPIDNYEGLGSGLAKRIEQIMTAKMTEEQQARIQEVFNKSDEELIRLLSTPAPKDDSSIELEETQTKYRELKKTYEKKINEVQQQMNLIEKELNALQEKNRLIENNLQDREKREQTLKQDFINIYIYIDRLFSKEANPSENEIDKLIDQLLESRKRIQQTLDISKDELQEISFSENTDFQAVSEDTPSQSENLKAQKLLDKIISQGADIDAFDGNLDAQLMSASGRALGEILMNFSKHLLVQIETMKQIKNELDETLPGLEMHIKQGDLAPISDETLHAISIISPHNTMLSLQGEIDLFCENHNISILYLNKILTRYILSHTKSLQMARKLFIEISNIQDIDPKIKDSISKTEQELWLIAIDPNKISLPNIQDNITSQLFKYVLEEANALKVASRQFRKDRENNEIPTGKKEIEMYVGEFQRDLLNKKIRLAQLEKDWNFIEPHLLKMIGRLKEEVNTGHSAQKIDRASLEKMAIVRAIPINTIEEQEIIPFQQSHKAKEQQKNSLISLHKEFYSLIDSIKFELQRQYVASISLGKYATETASKWTPSFFTSEDAEISKYFPAGNRKILS